MYTIVLMRDGRSVTSIGAPIRTLSEALKQVESLRQGLDATDIGQIVGCRWTTASGSICALIIVNAIGEPIKSKN